MYITDSVWSLLYIYIDPRIEVGSYGTEMIGKALNQFFRGTRKGAWRASFP